MSTVISLAPTATTSRRTYPSPFGWRRVRVVLVVGLGVALVTLPTWPEAPLLLAVRLLFLGAVQLAAFALFEHWPVRLPHWVARWALQVASVGIVVPFAMAIAFALTTPWVDARHWFDDPALMRAYSGVTMLCLLVSPWVAVAASLRQIKDEAHKQALEFELERSQLARQALEARMRVVQAQVEPHFLFNTLANVRELVQSGSPQAVTVLDSLITYLAAAVPRLHSENSTLEDELALVRAYLEIMQMRMPDRLQYSVAMDEGLGRVRCPPMLVLTLVENAVRHGIDPSATGGRIDVRALRRGEACRLEIVDTGVGVGRSTESLGTGLTTLRERLALAYGDRARFELREREPRGTCAVVEIPAEAIA